jgi:hypothetical protein
VLGHVIAVAGAVLVVVTAIQVARTSIADSLVRSALVRHELDDMTVTAPAGWREGRRSIEPTTRLRTFELVDPDNLVILVVAHTPSIDATVTLGEWVAYSEAEAKARDFDKLDPAPDRVVLPTGWEGKETLGIVEDAMGNTLHWRIAIGAKRIGSDVVLVRLYLPDTMAHAAPAVFHRLIDSVGPR